MYTKYEHIHRYTDTHTYIQDALASNTPMAATFQEPADLQIDSDLDTMSPKRQMFFSSIGPYLETPVFRGPATVGPNVATSDLVYAIHGLPGSGSKDTSGPGGSALPAPILSQKSKHASGPLLFSMPEEQIRQPGPFDRGVGYFSDSNPLVRGLGR
jgi:hypothetical protein